MTSLPPSTAFRVGELEYTDSQGRRYRLGFDETTSPPGVVWIAVQTWGYMKQLIATWDDVRTTAVGWAAAKGF